MGPWTALAFAVVVAVAVGVAAEAALVAVLLHCIPCMLLAVAWLAVGSTWLAAPAVHLPSAVY